MQLVRKTYNMKKLVIVILLIGSVTVYSQGVEYVYDDAGNRIQRKQFVFGGGEEGTGRMANSEEDLSNHLTEDLQLTIYPNPVKETIHLKVTGNFQPYRLTIIDLTGKVMLNVAVNEQHQQFNLSDLAKGTYLLRASVNGGFAEWKMVKQ